MDKSLGGYGLVPFFARQVLPDEIGDGGVGRIIEVQRSRVAVTDVAHERSIPLPMGCMVSADKRGAG